MSILRNPELKGILVIVAVVALLAGVLAAMTGKLDRLNLPLLTGPRVTDKIIFISGGPKAGEVESMDLDGSDRKQLTEEARVVSGAAISPAGNRILYIGTDKSGPQIFSIGAGGGKPKRLTGSNVTKSLPLYSPDGKNISFIAAGKVYVAQLNGDDLDPVLPAHEELHSAMTERAKLPTYSLYSWAPGQRSMVGVTRAADGSDVLMFLAEPGSGTRPLVAVVGSEDGVKTLVMFPGAEKQPQPLTRVGSAGILRVNGVSWARENPVCAISLTIENLSAVLLFDPQQEQIQPVFAVQGQEFGAPAISPDGTAMVLPASYEKGKRQGLLKLDPEAPDGPTLLSDGEFRDLSYSPQGDRILATRVEGSRRDIVLIDVSNGDVTELTSDGHSEQGVWSPMSEQ